MAARLERKRRARGLKVEKVPEVPEEFAHILFWYEEIRSQTLRGFRFEPIQFSEILAYREAHHLHERMDSFEIGLLTLLDGLWRKAQPAPEEPSNDNGRGGRTPPPQRGRRP
jgi:hypothetical protein